MYKHRNNSANAKLFLIVHYFSITAIVNRFLDVDTFFYIDKNKKNV